VSGVAKDDAVGLDGDFTFRISDLLANDGGSVKDVASQFRFGTTEADWADQTAYLTKHGITANSDGSYTIHSGADDFQYMMQTGNKGTWSTANVDVTAPEPHLGDNLFTENFDGYQETQKFYDPADSSHFVFGTVNLETASGWTNASYVELGANGYGDIASTTGEAWLDTQKSQGQIDISHVFQDTTAAIEGKTAVLSFDVGVQSLDYLPLLWQIFAADERDGIPKSVFQ
jgi:hypothetical protein